MNEVTFNNTQVADTRETPTVGDILPVQQGDGKTNVWETPEIGASYAHFALAKWYVDLNHLLINSIDPKPGQTILDIGCGTGSVTRLLAEKVRSLSPGCEIVGIDYSAEMVRFARETVPLDAKIQYVQSSAEEIAENGSIPQSDIIISANALHLFQNLNQFLDGVVNKLRSQGTLAFSSLFTDLALDRESSPPWIKLLKSIRKEAKESFASESKNFKLQSESRTVNVEPLTSTLTRLGFIDVTYAKTAITIPYDSALSFMLIPGIREQFLPSSIDENSCRKIFNKVLQDCEKQHPKGMPRFSVLITATKA